MPDERDPQAGAPLDFDRADWSDPESAGEGTGHEPAGEPPGCGGCGVPLGGQYYLLGDRMLCERCQYAVRESGPPGNAFSRWSGASVLGLIAAALGGGLWYFVTDVTGYELGLIAIVVGFAVGAAVKLGARGVGGVPYQLLAVVLTYSAIVMTYVPVIVTQIRSPEFQSGYEAGSGEIGVAEDPAEADLTLDADPAPAVRDAPPDIAVAILVAIPIAFAAPFLMGFENVIGILIIGFALYQAWNMNARVHLEPQGPFQLGARESPLG